MKKTSVKTGHIQNSEKDNNII